MTGDVISDDRTRPSDDPIRSSDDRRRPSDDRRRPSDDRRRPSDDRRRSSKDRSHRLCTGEREMDSPDRRPGCRTILRTRAPSVCCGQSSAGQRARHAFPTAHHGTLRREAILWAARPIRDNSYPTPWGRCGCFREGRDLNPSSFPAAWATWYQTYRSIDDAMTNPESNEARPTGGPTHGVRGLHVAGLLRCGT